MSSSNSSNASSGTKRKSRGSSPFRPSAKVAMEKRAERAARNKSLAETASYYNSNGGTVGLDYDTRAEYIRDLMIEAGLEIQDYPSLNFANPLAASGVEMGLKKLVYNPGSANEDLTLPWAGKNRSPEEISRSLLKRLKVQPWAKELKENVLSSFSAPNVEGMLREGNVPNKDLAQLLTPTKPINWSAIPESQTISEIILDQMSATILDYWEGRDDDLIELVKLSSGTRKLRIKNWSLDTFKSQMAKAINNSSPGYPYNGYQWDSVIGDQTCTELVWQLGQAFIAEEEPEGFLFFQQSRSTGDGGAGQDGTYSKGQERLVQAAEGREKLPGHMIAYAFKAPIKTPLLSGQRGVQEVSRHLKALSQGKMKVTLGDSRPRFVAYWDVSKWDTAQTDQAMEEGGFFALCESIFDMDCEFTRRLVRNYKAAYKNRWLLTAIGKVRCKFLPSGSSITTVSAFVNHERILRFINWVVISGRVSGVDPKDFILEFGLQGDDFVALLSYWNERCETAVRETYAMFNCVIKGQMQVKSLDDPDCSAIFLNEAVRLADPIDQDTNAKFPKWNLFYAENALDKARGANIDRMLLEEIRSREAHPSPSELAMASLLSKLDRFQNMPFYDFLIEKLMKWSVIPLYSWIAERVMPNSFTFSYLRKREESRGIEWPPESQRMQDRRQETWMLGDELGETLAVLWSVSQISSSANEVIDDIVKLAKLTPAYKRARAALDAAGYPSESEVPVTKASEVITAAFNVGYRDLAQAIRDNRSTITVDPERVDDALEFAVEEIPALATAKGNKGEIMSVRKLIRSVLAMNATDPFSLRTKAAQAVIAAYCSIGWSLLLEDETQRIENWFEDTYGIPLAVAAENPLDQNVSEALNRQTLIDWLS